MTIFFDDFLFQYQLEIYVHIVCNVITYYLGTCSFSYLGIIFKQNNIAIGSARLKFKVETTLL